MSTFNARSDGQPDPNAGATRWSLVGRLAGRSRGNQENGAWQSAWEHLCKTYQPAMIAHVRRTLRRCGGSVAVDEAEDIVQDFLVECLSKGHLLNANPSIGRFRAFLAVCLRYHTTKYVSARHAKRRHPHRPLVALEDVLDLLDGDQLPDTSFSQDWARCLIESAVSRVRVRSESNARLLQLLFVQPDQTVDDLADRLDVDRGKIPLRTHRARKMLAQEIWAEIKETVSSDDDFERERAELQPLLSHYLDCREAPSLWAHLRSA